MQGYKLDQLAENLYRVAEFHRWIRTNVLFPEVPDSIVHPLMTNLRDAEHQLMQRLYDHNALDKIAAMQNTLVRDR